MWTQKFLNAGNTLLRAEQVKTFPKAQTKGLLGPVASGSFNRYGACMCPLADKSLVEGYEAFAVGGLSKVQGVGETQALFSPQH